MPVKILKERSLSSSIERQTKMERAIYHLIRIIESKSESEWREKMERLINHLINIIEQNDTEFKFTCGSKNEIVIYDKENGDSYTISVKKNKEE